MPRVLPRPCPVCQVVFTPKRNRGACCGKACGYAYAKRKPRKYTKRKYQPKLCVVCFGQFVPKSGSVETCGVECRKERRRRQLRERYHADPEYREHRINWWKATPERAARKRAATNAMIRKKKLEQPEFLERVRQCNREYMMNRYRNDPEFRALFKSRAQARARKLNALKAMAELAALTAALECK